MTSFALGSAAPISRAVAAVPKRSFSGEITSVGTQIRLKSTRAGFASLRIPLTRTWYSLAGADLFAVAGIWRWSEEWGEVYSMVMVDGCPQMADAHDRMPVILRPDAYDAWMRAPADEALMVRTCDDELAIDRTDEPWYKPRRPARKDLLV